MRRFLPDELLAALGLLVLLLVVGVVWASWRVAAAALASPPPPEPVAVARRHVPARALVVGILESYRQPSLLPAAARLTSDQVANMLQHLPALREDARGLDRQIQPAQRAEYEKLWPGWIGQSLEWEALCHRLEVVLREQALESSWPEAGP